MHKAGTLIGYAALAATLAAAPATDSLFVRHGVEIAQYGVSVVGFLVGLLLWSVRQQYTALIREIGEMRVEIKKQGDRMIETETRLDGLRQRVDSGETHFRDFGRRLDDARDTMVASLASVVGGNRGLRGPDPQNAK